MRKRTEVVLLTLGTALLAGCSLQPNMPLIFGQSHTVGISIGGNTTEGGAELTIGYKDRDIAIVPVTVEQANGDRTQLEAVVGGSDRDAFSVLGQFELDTQAGPQAKAGLGKFFATGLAARRLADGFACIMNEGEDCKADQSQSPAPAPAPAVNP